MGDFEKHINIFQQTLDNSMDKVRLNLSDYAWSIINADMEDFTDKENRSRLSDFINLIFNNYFEESPANLQRRYIEKKDEYEILFQQKELKDLPEKEKQNIIEKLLEKYIAQEAAKLQRFPKGKPNSGRNVRIKSPATFTIEEFAEDRFEIVYFKRLGMFLKIIVELYCELPYTERERIIYQKQINIIEKAIAEKKAIVITTKSQETFEILPHKVIADDESTFNYVTCKARDYKSAGDYLTKCFRISRIEHISWMKTEKNAKGYLHEDEIQELNDLINVRGVQFISADCINAKILLTKKGVKYYATRLRNRPEAIHIGNEDEKGNREYTFFATPIQLEIYFQRFGQDAIVLEPDSLRKKFIKMYRDALVKYEEYI